MGGLYTSFPSRAFYPPLEILDAIPRGRPERMTSLSFAFLPNTSALYELEDVRGYEAMTLASLTETSRSGAFPNPSGSTAWTTRRSPSSPS